MYITELSLSDFRKLGKIGYEETKVETGNGCYRLVPKIVEDMIPEGEVEYAMSFPHKTIALFYNDASDYEKVEDALVLDKFYVRRPATYCSWAGVEHIYSEKGRWLIKADSECGTLSKSLFDKIYLIHVEE